MKYFMIKLNLKKLYISSLLLVLLSPIASESASPARLLSRLSPASDSKVERKNQCQFLFTSGKLPYATSDYVFANEIKETSFIVPNETRPDLAKQALKNAPKGAILTFGSERGNIDASLGPNIDAVIFADKQPGIIAYHLVNKALLSISNGRQNYLYLRMFATHQDIMGQIKKNSENLAHLSADDMRALSDVKLWDWWSNQVRAKQAWDIFYNRPEDNPNGEFLNANYLHDDVLFQRVASIAKANRMFVLRGNLKDPEFIQRILHLMESQDIFLSVLDLSNAWEEGHIGHAATETLITTLTPRLAPSAFVLLTFLAPSEVKYFQYFTINYHEIVKNNLIIAILRNFALRSQFVSPTERYFPRSRLGDFD